MSKKEILPNPQQLEKDLLESKQIFKVIFENSPAAILVTDANDYLVAWNPMTEAILGMSRIELFNKPIDQLYTTATSKVLKEGQWRRKGTSGDLPASIKRRDNTIIDISVAVSVVKDGAGQITGSIHIWHDISRQKKAEGQLRESENKLRIILDNSAAAITVGNDKEQIISWNVFAETMLGMTKEDLFERPISSFYPPEEWKKIRQLNIIKDGFRHHVETKVIRKDGTIIDIDLSVNILKDEAGKLLGSIGLMQDITEAKRTREMLLQAKIEAEEANNAKSIFLAKMSHEIRTPMNAVIGMLDLTMDTTLSEEQRDNLKVAKDAADNLLSLINDILDLSRAQSGKVVIEDIELNFHDVVKNVCKGLMVLARNKGIDLVWEIDAKIPRLLIGDPVRLRQILVNLINNAVKFTNKGTVKVKVSLREQTAKDCQVYFEIIDQGIGVPQKNLTTIFDVFTEAHNTTARRYGGTGLGLAICKKLVEMMRGSLSVSSIEGQGSTFAFDIIFGLSTNTSNGVENDQPVTAQAKALPEHLKSLRILVAEDNMVNSRIVVKTLEKFGWHPVTVADGQAVLDILLNQPFDIILMDDQMPKLNGTEAVQVIRREEKQTGEHLPIIAMTANAMAGDRERYLASGMDGYVSKPIDRQVLYNEIVKVINQRLN